MTIFHLFAVTLANYAEHEQPRVQYHDFMVQAHTRTAALAAVEDEEVIQNATEVWAAPTSDIVVVRPSTSFNRTETVNQHVHWARHTETYKRVRTEGPTLATLVSARFDAYMKRVWGERAAA